MAIAERLAFSAVTSVPAALCVEVAIAMVSTGRRRSREDIGGSAAGPPSERIAVRAAFLHNTHEQAIVAVVMYFAYGAVFTGAWLSLLPICAAFFVVGRVLFLRGYVHGTQGRALGGDADDAAHGRGLRAGRRHAGQAAADLRPAAVCPIRQLPGHCAGHGETWRSEQSLR